MPNNADADALLFLEREIARNNIEAVAADRVRPDDMKRPEVVALLESATAMVAVIRDRDDLADECAFLRQQLAVTGDKCAKLENTLTQAIAQRDYFRTAFSALKENSEAIERIVARNHVITAQGYVERFQKSRASDALSPKDDGAPIPTFLGAGPMNVVKLQGRPSA